MGDDYARKLSLCAAASRHCLTLAKLDVMRMKKTHSALLTVIFCGLAACTSTRNVAPVVDHAQASEHASARPAASATARPAPDRHGYYTVRKGDTLLQIALDFGQNYRDLVVWNNLSNPDDIKIDQVLRVLPPEAEGAAVQVGSVAAPTAVEVKPLPAPTATTSQPAAAPVATVPHKTGPRGDKRIYSEAALADMQKSAGPFANSPAAKTETAKAAEPKPAEAPPASDDAVLWIWPAEGKIIAGFDETRKGIDIAGQLGQQVVAAGAGRVMYAGSGIRGYGNLVIVKHTNNLLSAYAHNRSILVKEGQTVSKGQKIAEMGNSDTDTVKLHFEIRQQGKPVDPSKFLPNR
jgi:lipoprotein NlpD